MKKIIFLTILASFIISLPACKSGKETVKTVTVKDNMMGGVAMMPKATVFRMSGDYADNVAVTLNPDGTLAYFPAPTDITVDSSPLALGNGWYLNRQGIGQNSVFTKWTFKEYSRLPKVPSATEIKDAIIPGATVTEFRQLPLSLQEALANPADCLQYVE